MILDTNILLYAWNNLDPHHLQVKQWLEDRFRMRDTIGIPWVSRWGFLRVSTNPRLFDQELSPSEAVGVLRDWDRNPFVSLPEPGRRHADLLESLMVKGKAIGPMSSDAVLAALAMEHGAELASTDRDFSRFPGLRWVNPLD